MPLTDPKPRKPGSQLLLRLEGKTAATAGKSRDPIGTSSVARSTAPTGRCGTVTAERVWPRSNRCAGPYVPLIDGRLDELFRERYPRSRLVAPAMSTAPIDSPPRPIFE
jgi:hypothetical protein